MTRSRHLWDAGLLLFMVIGATGVKLWGIDTLLSPDLSPLFIAVLMVAGFLGACVVMVLVLNEGGLIKSYGPWVMVAAPAVQAGFFSAVLLFMPLPWVLLRFSVAFLMAGGHFTVSNVSAHYRIRSRLSGATASPGFGSSFFRNSMVAGLLLGVLGSLAIVAFVNSVTRDFSPLGNSSTARSSGSPSSVNQSNNALLASLWISIGLIVLAVNAVRKVMDRRSGQDDGTGLSSTPGESAGFAPVERPATPLGEAPDPDNDLERLAALRRIREVMSQGDISAIRFESSVSHASVFVEHVSDEAIELLMSGTINDILMRLPEDARLDIQIGRIYFGGSDTAPYVKKSIVVRKAEVRAT